eukprot:2190999-Pyramimonas_sp.AAC.1
MPILCHVMRDIQLDGHAETHSHDQCNAMLCYAMQDIHVGAHASSPVGLGDVRMHAAVAQASCKK